MKRAVSAWLFLCLLAATGCLQSRQGCLDVTASNFDASADNNCCCTYPQLRIEWYHRADTGSTPFAYGAFQYQPGRYIRLDTLRFYISGIELVKADNSAFTVSDTVQLRLGSGAAVRDSTVPDNFVLLTADGGFPAQYGKTFRQPGTYERIRFYLGVYPGAADTDPTARPSTHPLSIQSDTMWSATTGYYNLKLNWRRDTLSATPRSRLTAPAGTAVRIEKALPAGWNARQGYDAYIRFNINYGLWLSGVDFSGSDQAILAALLANAPAAFSVAP